MLQSIKLFNSEYCSAENIANNPKLSNACSCSIGMQKFSLAVDQYKIQYNYWKKKSEAYDVYKKNLFNWQLNYNTVKSSYQTQTAQGRDCAFCACLDDACNSLKNIYLNKEIENQGIKWAYLKNEYVDWFTCEAICTRSADGVKKLMDIWEVKNPQPTTVNPPGNAPIFNANFACNICNNVIDLAGTTSLEKIENVKQSCDQKITQEIVNASYIIPSSTPITSEKPTTSETPTTTQIPIQKFNNMIILIVIISFIVIPLFVICIKFLLK